MKNEYECIVVGGGIAGSSAACHLARKGYQVALIERTALPHHKVCGEFVSFEAIEYLKTLGIDLNNYPAIKQLNLATPQSEIHFSFPSFARGISRLKLDEWVIDRAKEARVSVIRGVAMTSFRKEKIFRVSTTSDEFFTPHLFIATGKYDYSVQSKRLGKDSSYVGLKVHVGIPSQELKESIMLFTFSGGYGGVSPVENGRMNFCFVIKKELFKSLKGDFHQSVSYMRRCNRKLDSILEEFKIIDGPFAIGYIPYGFLRLRSFEDDVYFIGDQRMVIPSFTGDGIAIALNTSLTAVEEFDRKEKGKPSLDSNVEHLRHQMRWAMRGHRLLKNPIAPILCRMPLCGHFVIKTIFQQTRVGKREIL